MLLLDPSARKFACVYAVPSGPRWPSKLVYGNAFTVVQAEDSLESILEYLEKYTGLPGEYVSRNLYKVPQMFY